MIKAFFVDFYGTLVHEDGEVIKKMVIKMKLFKGKHGIRI